MRAIERRLRERIARLEKEKAAIEEDREKFREHFSRRFRWWIELLGQQSTPSLPWVKINRTRNPGSWKGKQGKMKDHDLCKACWKKVTGFGGGKK